MNRRDFLSALAAGFAAAALPSNLLLLPAEIDGWPRDRRRVIVDMLIVRPNASTTAAPALFNVQRESGIVLLRNATSFDFRFTPIPGGEFVLLKGEGDLKVVPFRTYETLELTTIWYDADDEYRRAWATLPNGAHVALDAMPGERDARDDSDDYDFEYADDWDI